MDSGEAEDPRAMQELTRDVAEFISRAGSSKEQKKVVDLELANERLQLRIQMQENRMRILKSVRARDYKGFLQLLEQESGHFCYCGGKALDVLRAEVKERFLGALATPGNEGLIESLFSTNEDFDLNRRFWQLKRQFLVKKIEELKTQPGQSVQVSSMENLAASGDQQFDKGLLRLVSLSNRNLDGQAQDDHANGGERVDKDVLIEKLREDLKNIISISEQRKINRSILQSQFLKSGVFRKIVETNRAHAKYISELEQKIQQLGSAILEIEWRRRNELDELVFREREGGFVIADKRELHKANEQLRRQLKQAERAQERLKRVKRARAEAEEPGSVEAQLGRLGDIIRRNEQAQASALEMYKGQLKRLESENQILRNKHAFYKKKTVALEAENNALKTGQFLEAQILERKFRHSTHREVFRKLEALITDEQLRKESRELRKYVKVREEKISGLEKQVKSAARETENLRRENGDYSDQMIKLWKENEDLLSLNKSLENDLKNSMDHKERQRRQLEDAHADARREAQKWRDEATRLGDQSTAQTNQARQLKKGLKEMKRFLQVNEEALAQANSALEDSKRRLEQQTGRVESLVEENRLVRQNNRAFKEAHERLSKDLADKIEQIGKFESMLSRIRKSRQLRKQSEQAESVDFDQEDFLLMRHEHSRLEVRSNRRICSSARRATRGRKRWF